MTDQRVLDDLAIRNLTNAYSHACMRLDWVAAAAVYAEDGVLSAFSGPDIVGRPAIEKAFKRVLEPNQFLIQTCAAGMVDVQGDAARASWSVSDWFQAKTSEDLSCCFGVYEDQLKRTAEGWRFARRRFSPLHLASFPAKNRRQAPPEAFINTYAPWPFVGVGAG